MKCKTCEDRIGTCRCKEGHYIGSEHLENNTSPDWCPKNKKERKKVKLYCSKCKTECTKLKEPCPKCGDKRFKIYEYQMEAIEKENLLMNI